MPEPRPDMFPDQSQTDPTPATPQENADIEIIEDPTPEPETPVEEPEAPSSPVPDALPPAPKVVKTPDKELSAALQEERRKRKELQRELELERIKNSSVPSELDDEVLSEEGKILKAKVDAVTKQLNIFTQAKLEEEVARTFPQIVDKAEEFEAYRSDPENAGMSLKTAAKAFVYEKGLIATNQPRKGVEPPTHGPKNTPDKDTWTAADVDRLMKTDYKQFEKLVRTGKIDPDKIVGTVPEFVPTRNQR